MELIQSDQKLSINIQKGEKLIEIVGTILNVHDDRIDIELPQYFMRYIECLDVGKPLTVKVFSKLGTIDFNTVVITSPLEEVFSVELDYNAIKFTPESELPVVDSIVKLKLKRSDNDIVTVDTIELSTEYITCSCDIQLNIEEKLDCELLLPEDYGTISFKATVIKQDIVYDNEYTLSCYGMNEYDRQTLLYYMYMYMIEYDK